jgi:hypothetical protein
MNTGDKSASACTSKGANNASQSVWHGVDVVRQTSLVSSPSFDTTYKADWEALSNVLLDNERKHYEQVRAHRVFVAYAWSFAKVYEQNKNKILAEKGYQSDQLYNARADGLDAITTFNLWP